MLWWIANSFALDIPMPTPAQGFETVKLTVGGFVQPRFTRIPSDSDAATSGTIGFSVRRVRLENTVSFQAQQGVDLTSKISLELMPEARLVDAYIDAGMHSLFNIRFGQQKSGSNRSLMISDKQTLFPERGALQELVPRREMGLTVHGLTDSGWIAYSLGVFNGEGTNRLANVNRKMMGVGRVVLSPIGSPGTTTELMNPDDPTTVSLGYAFHINQVGPEGQQEGTYGHNAEAFAHWKWMTLQAEYLYRNIDWEDTSIADYTQGGWYVQLGSFVPGTAWTQQHLALLLRVEEIDEFEAINSTIPLVGPTDPAQRRRNLSVGFGLYAGKPWFAQAQDLRIQLVYTNRSELENLTYDDDEVTIAAHLTF